MMKNMLTRITLTTILAAIVVVGCSSDDPAPTSSKEYLDDPPYDLYFAHFFLPIAPDGERVVLQFSNSDGSRIDTLIDRELSGKHAVFQTDTEVLLTNFDTTQVLFRHRDYEAGVYFIILKMGDEQSRRQLVIPPPL
jgi:hypothetical protein